MSVVTYDDRDPIIHYSTGWTLGGNPGDVDGTSTFTTTNGSTATITFTGVQISVFGTVPLVIPKTTSSYSVDGGPPTLFTAPIQIQGSGAANSYVFQQQYYQSPQLAPNKPHTLVITNAVNSPTQFFLDFIRVVPAVSTTITSSTSTGPTSDGTTPATTTNPGTISSPTVLSSPTSTSTSTTTHSLSSTSDSPSTAPASSTSDASTSPLGAAAATTLPTVDNKTSSPPIGTIVGSVIGGLAVILLGIGVYLLWRQTRRRNRPISVAPTLHPFPTPAEYQDSQPYTSAPASSVAASSRSPTGKSQDLGMVQHEYASVSDPRHSRFTLLEHPPPQYQR